MLNVLAYKCNQSRVARYSLFALAAVVSICITGYYFGTFDQASHIPYLKKSIDPQLYPNDHFFDLSFYHYSYFWSLFKPFYRLGLLEIVMFATHLFSLWLTFFALWRLATTLFNKSLTSFLAVLIFIVPHIGFGGFPTIEFSLLNRTFAFPFLLFAIDFYLKKRYIQSFLFLGIMYNFHAISTTFVLILFGFDILQKRNKTQFIKLIPAICTFLIFSIPVLLWKFGNSTLDLSENSQWFHIIDQGMLHNVFSIFDVKPYILISTISGITTFILFFVAKAGLKKTPHDRTITNFVGTIAAVLILEVVVAHFYAPIAIVQFQIIRIGIYLVIFSYLYFLHYIVQSYQQKKYTLLETVLLIVSIGISFFPPALLLNWLINTKIAKLPLRQALMFIVMVGGTIITLYFLFKMDLWRPGIHLSAQKTPWFKTQVWARTSTPKNALFITPPHRWWLYETEWRVGSERSTVSTLSELLEAAFVPSYIPYWQSRFDDVAPGAREQFNGDIFNSLTQTKKAFYSHTTEAMVLLANKYKASYLVIEKPFAYKLPIVYENEQFVVYRFPQ